MQAIDPRSSAPASLLPLPLRLLSALILLWPLAACSGDDGDQGPPGPPGDAGPTSTDLDWDEDAPGVNVEILALAGGSGPGGAFQVGNTPRVTFRLTKDDGSEWDVTEMVQGRMLVSGPTFNYQRVLAQVNDVNTNSVDNGDGTFTYTFPSAIPATYLPPLNDSASFGPEEGELTGQPLLSGTYTLGAYFRWDYTVEGEPFRDSGDVTHDFLLGSASTIEHRAVVERENCNRCHVELQAHGGSRRDVTLCLLCHTAGSEDRNVASAAGGTPGVSVDFRVMVHRIHAGKHLPSVNGVDTNPDGSRTYTAPIEPYLIVGNNDSIHDFSGVSFPVWPDGLIPMPRDQGYTALSADAKALEDVIRTGPASCEVCHGDPDGDGPLTLPAQGSLHQSQPSRAACGACHDDIHWGLPYTANGSTMPEQANDSNCILCHEASGDDLSVFDAHRHPLENPAFNPGLVFDLEEVVESGTNNGDGTVDVGERVEITFRVEDEAGAEVLASTLGNTISVVISGPTENQNLLLSGSIPTAALTGAQPFTVNVPETLSLEYVGTATAGADVFPTSRAPHWNVASALTSVLRRSATGGGATALTAPAGRPQNFVDVASTAGFARDDYVVIDDGVVGVQEYHRISLVDGNRLWFSPGTRNTHAAGATVLEVTLVSTNAYTLNAAAGTLTENGDLGTGSAILVTYTSDFVMPAFYPLPINDSPDLGPEKGEWRGLPIVDGTYSIGVWGTQALTLNLFGESNSYRNTARAPNVPFLVGGATEIEPYDLISSSANCEACHFDVQFHGGGRRGFDDCILCHGAAGGEDRPRYTAANAPPTTGAGIHFREMLHKIHMGEELANASLYTLVGFGSGAYPNNFTAHTYEEVVFPALPGGVQNCEKCHGTSESWKEPAPRDHPAGQAVPTQVWRDVCNSCHDSDAATAHIEVQTAANGAESCEVCHGDGSEWSSDRVHKLRD